MFTLKGEIMTKIMFVSAVAALMTSTALAQDFNATQFVTTVRSGSLEFSVGSVDGRLNTFTTGATIAEYTLGRFDTNVYTSFTYGRLTNTLDLTLEYNLRTSLGSNWSAYGTAAVSYVTPTNNLGSGEVFVSPTLGLSYAVNDRLSLFGDVTHSWNASQSWNRVGGVLEIGADYAVNDRVSITPSLLRTFNTASDATNFRLEVGFRF
jgi:opacity protein-like surface antigen